VSLKTRNARLIINTTTRHIVGVGEKRKSTRKKMRTQGPLKGHFTLITFNHSWKIVYTKAFTAVFCVRHSVVMAIDVIPVIMYNSVSLNKGPHNKLPSLIFSTFILTSSDEESYKRQSVERRKMNDI
jgi:hypothetical protein